MQIFKYSSEIISDAHYFGNDSDPNEKRCCTDTRLGMGLVINDIKYDSNSAKVLTIPTLPPSHYPSTFHTHPIRLHSHIHILDGTGTRTA